MVSRVQNWLAKYKSRTKTGLSKLERMLSEVYACSTSPSSLKEKLRSLKVKQAWRGSLDSNPWRSQARLSGRPRDRYSATPPCRPTEKRPCVEQRNRFIFAKEFKSKSSSSSHGSSHSTFSVPGEGTSLDWKSEDSWESQVLQPPLHTIQQPISSSNHPCGTATSNLVLNSKWGQLPQTNDLKGLMVQLSQHQIEWAAMIELEKADRYGILRGLSARQIRLIVRDRRCESWLVETEGPLVEDEGEMDDQEGTREFER